MRTAVSAFPSPRLPGCWPGLRIARRYLLPPPPNSCSWVRDAVVLPITVVLLSCVGSRAFMIAPKRDNGNGFRTSDCKIAEYNIFSTLLYSSLLYSSLSIVSPEIPGNAVFGAYPRGYVLKTVFPLRLSCFSWDFGTMVCAASRDPFINFFHLVFHFSGHSGFSAPFFAGYPRK